MAVAMACPPSSQERYNTGSCQRPHHPANNKGTRNSFKRNQPVAANHVLDAALYFLKPSAAARLALQVIDDTSQCLEILPTCSVRTVVQILLICQDPIVSSFFACYEKDQLHCSRMGDFRCLLRLHKLINALWQKWHSQPPRSGLYERSVASYCGEPRQPISFLVMMWLGSLLRTNLYSESRSTTSALGHEAISK